MNITSENVYEAYERLKFYNFDLEYSKFSKNDVEKMIEFFINRDEFEKILILQRFLQDY
jgi:hypothetical protein